MATTPPTKRAHGVQNAVNSAPGGPPIRVQQVGVTPAQPRNTTRGRGAAHSRSESALHRTEGQAIRPIGNALHPRAVRNAPLVRTAPGPVCGRGQTRGGHSSGRIRVPRGLFRSCRHCYGTGKEDPHSFATFIHRLFTSRGGRFRGNAYRGRKGRSYRGAF